MLKGSGLGLRGGSTLAWVPPTRAVVLVGYPALIAGDAPQGYWRLDETASSIARPTVGAVTGTYSNVTLGVAGLIANDTDTAASFNGDLTGATGSYVALDNSFNFSSTVPFSLEAWVKPSLLDATARIIVCEDSASPAGGWSLYATSTDVQFVREDTSGGGDFAHSTTALTVGAITHVVATYNGSVMRIYFNGVDVTTVSTGQPSTRSLPTNSAPCRIGNSAISNQSTWQGVIDEPALYALTLTATQVAAHYNAGKAASSGGGGGSTGGGGSATVAPTYTGPWFSIKSPWRTTIPASPTAHPDSPQMVQDVYIGTDYSPYDVHAFAYRPAEMQTRGTYLGWSAGAYLTFMLWCGPGGVESIIYSPNGTATIPMWVDFPTYKASQVQVPMPLNWTGFGEQNVGSPSHPAGYYERRTTIYCENGDMWALYQIAPPGWPHNGQVDSTTWHCTIAEKVVGGWAGATPSWGGGGSGISLGPGLITPFDILNTPVGGHFNHRIAYNTANAADGSYTGPNGTHWRGVWPATKGINNATPADGRTKTAAGIPHGALVYLDPSLTDSDLASLFGLTKEWQLQIARTIQVYGMTSKESNTSQGDAGGLMAEFQQSIDWNKAHGFYPSSYVDPWKADGTATSDKDYKTAFPPSMLPESGSHFKVFDWRVSVPGITVPA